MCVQWLVVMSNITSIVTVFAFGMAPSYWWAFAARCLGGFFNCTFLYVCLSLNICIVEKCLNGHPELGALVQSMWQQLKQLRPNHTPELCPATIMCACSVVSKPASCNCLLSLQVIQLLEAAGMLRRCLENLQTRPIR